MATDLEQRRQAIADALRAVMAEPLPAPQLRQTDPLPRSQPRQADPPPVAAPSSQISPIRELIARVRTPDVPPAREPAAPAPEPAAAVREPRDVGREPVADNGLLTMREALASQIEWDDEADELTDDETHSVPPLELAGSMSRAASMALFGHA